MKNSIIIVSIILFMLNFDSKAQIDSTVRLKPHGIYTSAGYAGTYILFNANYENVQQFKNESYHSSWLLRAAVGEFADWKRTGENYLLSAALLIGKRNHYLEPTLGMSLFYDRTGYELAKRYYDDPFTRLSPRLDRRDYIKIRPAFGVGYRHQLPDKHFIFRLGAGYPEAVHFSVGWAFGK